MLRDGTNNEAEYHAALRGLEAAAGHGEDAVEVRSDSQVFVKQMTGEYATREERLQALREGVLQTARAFESVRFVWVPRTHPGSQRADALANEALIKAGHPKVEWKGPGRR